MYTPRVVDFSAFISRVCYSVQSLHPHCIHLSHYVCLCAHIYISVGFWTNERIKAFLSGVPDTRMIILDLNSEQSPLWRKTESYFGKPFVWCLLHNYGGTRGIYGNLTTIGTSPLEALNTPGSTMVGVGMTPEAIEHNPIVYDLMVSRHRGRQTEYIQFCICRLPFLRLSRLPMYSFKAKQCPT